MCSSIYPGNVDVLFSSAFFFEYFQLILPIPIDSTGNLLEQEFICPAQPGDPILAKLSVYPSKVDGREWDYISSYSIDQTIGQNSDNPVPLRGSGTGTISLYPQTGGVRSNIFNIEVSGRMPLDSFEVKLKSTYHSETLVEKVMND